MKPKGPSKAVKIAAIAFALALLALSQASGSFGPGAPSCLLYWARDCF